MRRFEPYSERPSLDGVMMPALRDVVRSIAARCPGGNLPDSYLVLDLETSGLNWSTNVITQFGFAVVQDRKMVDNMAIYVKRPPGTMSEEAAKITGITDELLMEKGVEPATVFPQVLNLLGLYRKSGCMFMGHNMVSFDAPFLAADCERHDQDFRIAPNEYIDTGMMFKASQIRLTPGNHEDLHAFFCRVKDYRSHARWNLKLATQMLNVDTKHDLDLDKAHDAGFDCMMTHYVFEEMRAFAGL